MQLVWIINYVIMCLAEQDGKVEVWERDSNALGFLNAFLG